MTENPMVPLSLVMGTVALCPGVEKPLSEALLRALYIAGPTCFLGCVLWPFFRPNNVVVAT